MLYKMRITGVTVRYMVKWKFTMSAPIAIFLPIPILTDSVMVIGGANLKWQFWDTVINSAT